MAPTALLIIAAVGVALLLVLVLKFKFQPFLALTGVSIIVALAAGIPAADLVKTIEAGMGSTLGHIAIIIALGAMIGRIIEVSGGAKSLATTLINKFGTKRTPLALTVTGFLLGIPVFFEVGVIILMPLAYGVARKAKRPLLIFALPMCAALLTVHAFLPPHPGPVAVAGLLGIDTGRILLFGLPITAVVALACYFVAKLINRRVFAMDDDIRAEVYGPHITDADLRNFLTTCPTDVGDPVHDHDPIGAGRTGSSAAGQTGTAATPKAARTTVMDRVESPLPAPGFTLIAGLILLPILLILAGTIGESTLPEGSVSRATLTVLGAPLVALLLDALLCGYVLGTRRGWSPTAVGEIMGSAIPGVAMVILIAGAGGVFGKVLVASGIGDAVSDLLASTGLPVLVLAFVLTLLLRAVQGSATVALVTTAGIITPLVADLSLSPNHLALLALGMGGGALALSHINDAGYWIVVKLTGLSVGDGLRTWTVITTIAGTFGFLLVVGLWTIT